VAIPPTNELVTRNVTGLAIKKNNNAEYNENLALRPAESAIFTNKARKEAMWIIYRECQSIFTALDRYTVAIVYDEDILEYQQELAGNHGRKYELQPASSYLQQFVSIDDLHYLAKRMIPWKTNLCL
jgi:hypothetical protein